MNIVLARVDGRLVHGQVAVAWTRTVGADHIMVIHDQSAQDEMQKMLLELATPSGVKLTVSTVKDAASKLKTGGLSGKCMLIFKNPQDVARLVEEGIELKEVNIGGMYHEPGKKQIDKALFVGPEDLEAFETLRKHNVELFYQVAPMNSRENLSKKVQQ